MVRLGSGMTCIFGVISPGVGTLGAGIRDGEIFCTPGDGGGIGVMISAMGGEVGGVVVFTLGVCTRGELCILFCCVICVISAPVAILKIVAYKASYNF